MDPGRRAFLAVCIGAGLAVALGAVLRRLYTVGTFAYDGRQYSGPKVQKITPITPEDEFYQVSKNLVDPRVARSGWRLSIVGEVETPRPTVSTTSSPCPPSSRKPPSSASPTASAAA